MGWWRRQLIGTIQKVRLPPREKTCYFSSFPLAVLDAPVALPTSVLLALTGPKSKPVTESNWSHAMIAGK